MDSSEIKNRIFFFFDSLIKSVFGFSVEFTVVEHKSIKNGYVILLPPSGEMINYLIGRQGRTINALNVLVSFWAYKNNIILYVKQKRKENQNNEEINQ